MLRVRVLCPLQPNPQMEVGIEDCLHIEFEYDKAKYHLRVSHRNPRNRNRNPAAPATGCVPAPAAASAPLTRRPTCKPFTPTVIPWVLVTILRLQDVVVGRIYFLLVRIKLKYMEVEIRRKETTGAGSGAHNESDTIAKYVPRVPIHS